MPGFDGTGPLGYGPMTGRGAGYCAGFWRRGGVGLGMARRLGWGFTGGRGHWRPRWGLRAGYAAGAHYLPPQPWVEDERKFLEEQARLLEAELNEIREQLRRMDDEGSEEK